PRLLRTCVTVPLSSSFSQLLTIFCWRGERIAVRRRFLLDLLLLQGFSNSVIMGDFSIKISSGLINQLAKGNDDQPKRKAKRTKPKVSPQRKSDQTKTSHHDAEKPKPAAAELPIQPPFFFPIPQQAAASAELESIKSVLKESEMVLEKLERQEKNIAHEVTEKAKELREKEFKIPEPKPMPCSSDSEAWMKCYKENIDNPLRCSGLVMRYQDCARRFKHQVSSEEK
ncbi:unnamed protein product, partial [Thlaspi arvense]